ncbi:hypothetical protein RDI58_018331 [Solanum bulbocastanum]|uniref:Reverse transcriptase domain-containing protein n=1 Tax=Solanum bulbocastanum TaxID=147425 RepID=A0AAN8TGC0_SOLBU
MNRLKHVLSTWSKETYGDIFHKVAAMEDVVKVKELQFEINSTNQNRKELVQAEEELQYYKLEEEYWTQKSGMKWFNDRDRSTNFFHSYVKGRRRRLHINEMENGHGVLLKDPTSIGEEAVKVFEKQFSQDIVYDDQKMLDCIAKLITEEQKESMDRTPTEEEIKEAVFSSNSESACGPDGFSGKFFQDCWEIIKKDITQMVIAFFCGWELPRYVTHTNLVLITKKEQVTRFMDLRPISLSAYINKVISKVIHGRLSEVLPAIISKNQIGFIKG